ncbi:putative nucleoside-diphosphate-sugar epimerase [Aspergillus saccharolyticus JOP 1030-1]|uniref:Uncharacterized protein n=1 Tax=Aspergillus saccharolyticus JOP 1030-1 TaxID=1450539 RepID=A0A318ZFM3_9EURO|nr:hypothetical protein BP01DRAFT_422868 [Aspergillus saccharolyticus JOP 1030-1]PYH46351.1 hypothetical protein BP01DRAFT_422868 [Aspergillus saccharolyticus JOP 1030-1]
MILLSWSKPTLSASLRAVDACIWTLGVTPPRASADDEAVRRVTLEYTSQDAKAFNDAFTATSRSKSVIGQKEEASAVFGPGKSRFVCFSGAMAERYQLKPLDVYSRRIFKAKGTDDGMAQELST